MINLSCFVSVPIATAPLVLIADDDRSLRKLLNLALSQEGYQCVQVGSGEQVLQDFHRLRPDLMLLDAVMPDLDGFACCQHLRTQFKTTIPILMVTVLDDQDSIDRAFDVGATDYITKPIHWAVLRQRVKRLLHSYQLVKQAEQVQTQLDAAHAWENLQRRVLQAIAPAVSPLTLLAPAFDRFPLSFQADRVWLLQGSPLHLWSVETGMPSSAHEAVAGLEGVPVAPNAPWAYSQNGDRGAAAVPAAVVQVAQALEVAALLMAPIVVRQGVWGWLLMGRDQPQDWSPTEQDRMQDLARLIAIALTLAGRPD